MKEIFIGRTSLTNQGPYFIKGVKDPCEIMETQVNFFIIFLELE